MSDGSSLFLRASWHCYQICTCCRSITAVLNVHLHTNIQIHHEHHCLEQRLVFAICPNLIGYLSDLKTNIRLIILTVMSTNAKDLMTVGPVHSEIIGRICRFFSHEYRNEKKLQILNQTSSNCQISTRCKFTMLPTYSLCSNIIIRFGMAASQIKVSMPNMPILNLKLVAMATFLVRMQN